MPSKQKSDIVGGISDQESPSRFYMLTSARMERETIGDVACQLFRFMGYEDFCRKVREALQEVTPRYPGHFSELWQASDLNYLIGQRLRSESRDRRQDTLLQLARTLAHDAIAGYNLRSAELDIIDSQLIMFGPVARSGIQRMLRDAFFARMQQEVGLLTDAMITRRAMLAALEGDPRDVILASVAQALTLQKIDEILAAEWRNPLTEEEREIIELCLADIAELREAATWIRLLLEEVPTTPLSVLLHFMKERYPGQIRDVWQQMIPKDRHTRVVIGSVPRHSKVKRRIAQDKVAAVGGVSATLAPCLFTLLLTEQEEREIVRDMVCSLLRGMDMRPLCAILTDAVRQGYDPFNQQTVRAYQDRYILPLRAGIAARYNAIPEGDRNRWYSFFITLRELAEAAMTGDVQALYYAGEAISRSNSIGQGLDREGLRQKLSDAFFARMERESGLCESAMLERGHPLPKLEGDRDDVIMATIIRAKTIQMLDSFASVEWDTPLTDEEREIIERCLADAAELKDAATWVRLHVDENGTDTPLQAVAQSLHYYPQLIRGWWGRMSAKERLARVVIGASIPSKNTGRLAKKRTRSTVAPIPRGGILLEVESDQLTAARIREILSWNQNPPDSVGLMEFARLVMKAPMFPLISMEDLAIVEWVGAFIPGSDAAERSLSDALADVFEIRRSQEFVQYFLEWEWLRAFMGVLALTRDYSRQHKTSENFQRLVQEAGNEITDLIQSVNNRDASKQQGVVPKRGIFDLVDGIRRRNKGWGWGVGWLRDYSFERAFVQAAFGYTENLP